MRAAAWVFAFAAVAGGVVWLLVSRRSDAGTDRLLADLTADIDRGGVADLGRAQAVGRARARNGDLAGSARALEAAMIRAPAFAAARAAWAEVELDLGDAKTAGATLQALLEQAPRDVRVAMMLNEAQAALGEPATGP